MTVSNQQTEFPYVGNGVTVTFAYTCQVQKPGDLQVYVNGVPVTSGITKNGIGSLSGGSVTFSVPPASGAAVRLERVVVLERTTDYQQNGDFLARVVNPDFDRIWMALQQFGSSLSRALRFPKSDINPVTELPRAADRANKLLGFDASGNPLVVAPVSGSAVEVAIALAAAIATFFSSIGSSLIGFIQEGFGAIRLSAQEEMRHRPISIKQFGAVADFNVATNVGTDNSDAFDRALALALQTGRSIYIPTGRYKITRPIVMDTGVYIRGIIMFGEGRNSEIYQVGVGQDAFHFSTTQFLQNSGLRDMYVNCGVTSGHCINILFGCTTCFVSNVDLVPMNPAKSCIYGDYTSFGGGIFDTKFSGGSWYLDPASTVGGFVVRAKGTIFNENIFENLRPYQANTIQFFDIQTVVDGSIWLVNNSWKNINFEVCRGGGFKISSFKNCKFENISFWDSLGNYTNNLIDMIAGTGSESISNTFINVTRNGDALDPFVRDVRIVAGQDTIFMNCFTSSDTGPSYDFNNKRVTVIGRMFGLESRDQTTVFQPEIFSGISIIADDVSGGTLKIGSRATPTNATLTYAGGFLQVTPIPASSGIILNSTDAASVQSKLIFSPTEFYPLPDNKVSLGLASQRWTQVYAASATILTSDEDSKEQISGIDPAVLRAWSKVEFYQYKFRDAVEIKGDGARWHFGVVAQRVKEAFESEGLDAFAYGLLCYDEWEDLPAVMDEGADALFDSDGNEIKPARAASEIKPAQVAGARYGIRYEEALTLECAYLRSKII